MGTEKIRILHVVLSLDVGGLENGVVNIINGLSPERYESHVVCIQHKGDLAKRLSSACLSLVELRSYGRSNLRVIAKIFSIIKQRRINIVHSRNLKAYLACFWAAKAARVKLLHSEHGRDYPFSSIGMLQQRLYTIFTDKVVALSSDLKRSLVRYIGISPRKIRVIINGVDTKRFAPGSNEALRSELNIPNSAIVIGSVGRLVAVKNFGELIRGFHLLAKNWNNIYLVIVGDGVERHFLDCLILELGLQKKVFLLGERDDVNKVYGIFDIFALTSLNEGLSNTLLEAMASGKPVVASDVGGNSEIVVEDSGGMLYESGNVEQLVRGLDNLVNSSLERAYKGNLARQYSVNNYSFSSMIMKYEAIYSEL